MTVSRSIRVWTGVCGTLLVIAVLAQTTQASGFAVMERSSEGLGQAFAGATAGYDDGSAAYYNPAAMPWTDTQTLSAGLQVILPQADFANRSSAYAGGALPMPATDGGNGGVPAYVPAVYYSAPCGEQFAFGLAVNSPFGLASEWNSDWVGRYHGVKSDLMTLNMGPAMAWRPHPRLAVGASVSAMYLDAELSNAINFGAIAASMGLPGFAPGSADGFGTLTGDDWAYGFNVGLVVAPWKNGRLGVQYRSEVDATLEGDATFVVPAALRAAFASANMFVDTAGKVDLTLPQQASVGLKQSLAEQLDLTLEVGWTGWSSFNELRVNFASAQVDSVTDESWEDTWNFGAGLSYQVNPALRVRTGIAYDETPVPDALHRTPRIPDNDRLWAALGCSVKAADNVTLDLGYAHLFVDEAETAAVTATSDVLSGTFASTVDIVSLQGVLTF